MHESLRFVGKVLDGTIARTADRWFLSVTVEIPDPPSIRRENPAVVGVDLGVSALATLSTGEKIRGPKAYAAARRKWRQLSKQLSRQLEAAKVRAGLEPGQPTFLGEDDAKNAAPHGPTPCADCEYPGECFASTHD